MWGPQTLEDHAITTIKIHKTYSQLVIINQLRTLSLIWGPTLWNTWIPVTFYVTNVFDMESTDFKTPRDFLRLRAFDVIVAWCSRTQVPSKRCFSVGESKNFFGIQESHQCSFVVIVVCKKQQVFHVPKLFKYWLVVWIFIYVSICRE